VKDEAIRQVRLFAAFSRDSLTLCSGILVYAKRHAIYRRMWICRGLLLLCIGGS